MSDTDHDNAEPLDQSTSVVDTSSSMRLRRNRRVSPGCRAKCSPASPRLPSSVSAALIYALQTRDPGKSADELYSTDNRTTADGLAGLPRDYTGPVLGPALPGDLGRPILSAQNQGQPVVPPAMAAPGPDPEEQRRSPNWKPHAPAACFSRPVRPQRRRLPARMSRICRAGAGTQPGAETAQDRQLAFLNARRPPHHCGRSRHGASIALYPPGGRGHLGRAHHRHPLRSTWARSPRR
jgi:type IV secretion system protein VirB10